MNRELAVNEIEDVGGGNPALALAIGCVGGAVIGATQNGPKGAAVGCALGAAASVTSSLAAATAGFTRLGWATRSIGYSFMGGYAA